MEERKGQGSEEGRKEGRKEIKEKKKKEKNEGKKERERRGDGREEGERGANYWCKIGSRIYCTTWGVLCQMVTMIFLGWWDWG